MSQRRGRRLKAQLQTQSQLRRTSFTMSNMKSRKLFSLKLNEIEPFFTVCSLTLIKRFLWKKYRIMLSGSHWIKIPFCKKKMLRKISMELCLYQHFLGENESCVQIWNYSKGWFLIGQKRCTLFFPVFFLFLSPLRSVKSAPEKTLIGVVGLSRHSNFIK